MSDRINATEVACTCERFPKNLFFCSDFDHQKSIRVISMKQETREKISKTMTGRVRGPYKGRKNYSASHGYKLASKSAKNISSAEIQAIAKAVSR